MNENMIKDAYESGRLEVNGREYVFTKTTHQRRVGVLAFYTSVEKQIKDGNFSFLSTNEFKTCEKSMFDIILFNGMQLSKKPDHFESYPEDYIQLITIGMLVICYPFFRGVLTA